MGATCQQEKNHRDMKRQGPRVDSRPQPYHGVIAVCRHSSEIKLALTFRELCGWGKRSSGEEVDTGLHWPQPGVFHLSQPDVQTPLS